MFRGLKADSDQDLHPHQDFHFALGTRLARHRPHEEVDYSIHYQDNCI